MHLLPEVDCGPKAWTVLKELHAPTFIVATLMLERELSALRLSEGEPVQPVLDKMRDLYAKLMTTGITYPEQTKCLKMLSLLPESWLQFTSGLSLPQNHSSWTLEWVRTKIQEEDFRRLQLKGGDDGSSGYGMQGSRRGRGRGFGGAGRSAKKDDDSNDQQGGTGWGRGAKFGRGGKSEDASAKVGAELHPLDYWVLDTGAARTMTLRKDVLDDVRAAPIHEVCSASGHALKVAGAVPAAFKEADGKPVVLHDVLLVPDLKANLISLRKLAKAGVSTSTDGARTYKGQLGNRVLWDLHESKDVYRSIVMEVAHVPKTGASAIRCVHLGLAAESKGWLLWEPSKGVLFESRDLKFVEGMMYGSWEKQPDARVSQRMEQITMQLDLTPSVWEEAKEGAAEGGDRKKVQEAPAVRENDETSTSGAAGSEGGKKQQGKTKKVKGVVMKGWETPVSRPGRTRMATKKLTAGADVAEQQLGTKEALLILPHGYDPDEEDEPAYCFLAPAPEESASMEEAKAGPDREKWLVTIYKSRLVAKGFMQKEKQDFNEIFAPIAKPPALRVLLADAAVSGKFIIQMDISTAFLNGILGEDVYMTHPPGYEDGTGRVCKLKKSIYGLKQAQRCWYQKLAAVLEEMGFRTSSYDESLFLKREGEKLVLFLVYVDDILLFSSSMKEIQNVQQQLMENFKCKNLWEVKYYLGMHVERDPDHRWLKLHQEKFIKQLGVKYGIENERKVATPLPAEFKLVKAAEAEGVEAEEKPKFQSLVGSLLYAAVPRGPTSLSLLGSWHGWCRIHQRRRWMQLSMW
ncbi:unnamed protein product [Closterium sp. NIES-53]